MIPPFSLLSLLIYPFFTFHQHNKDSHIFHTLSIPFTKESRGYHTHTHSVLTITDSRYAATSTSSRAFFATKSAARPARSRRTRETKMAHLVLPVPTRRPDRLPLQARQRKRRAARNESARIADKSGISRRTKSAVNPALLLHFLLDILSQLLTSFLLERFTSYLTPDTPTSFISIPGACCCLILLFTIHTYSIRLLYLSPNTSADRPSQIAGFVRYSTAR